MILLLLLLFYYLILLYAQFFYFHSYNIHKDINKNSVVELQQFLQALHYVEGKHIDLEDTHCLLCNLIHDGQLKGYISLAHQKVVLSKTDPFPKLSAIASAT